MSIPMLNTPSLVEYGRLRFIITDCPTDLNLNTYLKELKKHNVGHVVRACESTYDIEPLTAAGVKVHDNPFEDGDPPPANVIESWLSLVNETFATSSSEKQAIAVHCVAGLGRAPVLVAIALIEEGLVPLDAVAFIRSRRRGAINAKQLSYLEDYTPKRIKQCCKIM